MKIVISPSKTMNGSVDNELNFKKTIPYFIEDSKKINSFLKTIEKNDLFFKNLEINLENEKLKIETIKNIDNFGNSVSFCIQKYEGIQFKNININNLDCKKLSNLENNLYILSAMYGILKISDNISSYRLMMNSKIMIENKNLYDYWREKINNFLIEKNEIILNLASKEYSKILDYRKLNIIDVTFYKKRKNGGFRVCSTFSKICRGLMVNELSNYTNITTKILQNIKVLNFRYNENLSKENHYIYLEE